MSSRDVIVVPTYNEKENIEALIKAIYTAVPDVQVLIVDDSSPDHTGDMVRSLMKQRPNLQLLSRTEKEGLGKAYVHAFRQVLEQNPDIQSVTMMDADLSHDPAYLPAMLEKLARADVVIGSRYVKGGGTEGWELWRRALSFFGNVYCRIVTRMPIRDCTGGFNMMRADMLRKVDFSGMDLSGYAFQMELKFALLRARAQFLEFPILFRNRVGGESKISGHIISEGIVAPWKLILKK